MNDELTAIGQPSGQCINPGRFALSGLKGVGMLEFLIALLIFSIGMLGLLSAQLAGKRAGYEALQQSVATALTRDILERIRANPARSLDYRVTAAGKAGHRVPVPGVNCDITNCTPEQLAVFDLWQWESLLLGKSESDLGKYVGGLIAPRACITNDDGIVEVVINWLGVKAVSETEVSLCGSDGEGGDAADDRVNSGSHQRNQLKIVTFIAEPR